MSRDFDSIIHTDRFVAGAWGGPDYMRDEYTRTFATPVVMPLGVRDGVERERVYVGRSLLPMAIRESMEASGGVRLIITDPR